MNMGQCWNDTDRGKLKYCEKKMYYNIGGTWMNDYGGMVE